MLILRSDPFYVVFNHDVLAALQTDRVLRSQVVDFVLLFLVDQSVLENLFAFGILFFVDAYFEQYLPINIVVLDAGQSQLIFQRVEISFRVGALVLNNL